MFREILNDDNVEKLTTVGGKLFQTFATCFYNYSSSVSSLVLCEAPTYRIDRIRLDIAIKIQVL